MDSTGKITGYKTQAGADAVFPFNSTNVIKSSPANIKTLFPNTYQNLTIDNFVVGFTNASARYAVPAKDDVTYGHGSTGITSFQVTKSYNNTTGILTFGVSLSTGGYMSGNYSGAFAVCIHH